MLRGGSERQIGGRRVYQEARAPRALHVNQKGNKEANENEINEEPPPLEEEDPTQFDTSCVACVKSCVDVDVNANPCNTDVRGDDGIECAAAVKLNNKHRVLFEFWVEQIFEKTGP